MKRGTFTKKGKPTKFAVEMYLKYFQLGGTPHDKRINQEVVSQLQEIMNWKEGEGIVCLMWGLHPYTKNCKTHEYYKPMVKAKEIAWDIYTNCII